MLKTVDNLPAGRPKKEIIMKKAETEIKKERAKFTTTPLERAETKAMTMLKESYNALMTLSEVRLESKLSNTRVARVAKELNELLKVMAVYERA